MMKQQNYLAPRSEVIELRSEHVICGSPLRYYSTPGSSGEDIDDEDIIDGGSF